MNSEPAIPAGIDVRSEIGCQIFRRRWLTWKVVPLAFFMIAWDSFLVFWYWVAFTKSGTPWLMIVFPLAHVAVGVGLTYYVIASFLNTTEIELSSGQLRIKTGPIPWPPHRDLTAMDIHGLRLKCGSANNMDVYEIRYRTPENREKKLVGGLTDDQAEYLVYHLRRTLGLTGEGNA